MSRRRHPSTEYSGTGPGEWAPPIMCPECGDDYTFCSHINCPIHGFTRILGESTYRSTTHTHEEIDVVGYACGCKEIIQ